MRNKTITHITSLVMLGVLLAPVAAFGAINTPVPPTGGGPALTGSGIIQIINTIVQSLLTVSVVIGVGYFVYGAIKYFALSKPDDGKKMMLNAVTGIALILAIGLILNTIAGLINRGLNIG